MAQHKNSNRDMYEQPQANKQNLGWTIMCWLNWLNEPTPGMFTTVRLQDLLSGPGQANTVLFVLGHNAQRPNGFWMVSMQSISFKSWKLYTYILHSNTTTTRSRRNLTALTGLRNFSSPMLRFWWSSQIMTLCGGYRGISPPPTKAKMLQRNNISTTPMPPLVKSRRNVSLKGSQL